MNVGFVQEFEYYFLNILLLEYNVLVENYARFPLYTIFVYISTFTSYFLANLFNFSFS